MKLSNRIIATLESSDFTDAASVGFRWALYSDGHVAAERVSRWQGTRDGARYVTAPDYVDLKDLNPDSPDQTAEALLTSAVREIEPETDSSFRQTNAGRIVR